MTNRNVPRKAATVFDLLGSVGTLVSKAKILLQELKTGMISFMMKLQAEWAVGMGSSGAWVMCRCLDVFVKEVVAERVITFVNVPLQTYKTVVYLQCV